MTGKLPPGSQRLDPAGVAMIPPAASECPPPPGGWPERMSSSEFEVVVIRRSRADGVGDLKETTTGGAKVVAAWLRALADEIDPRRPVVRDRIAGRPQE